ncbi:hypothetical protein C8R43DRAFT_1112120 [Mycena crocata]|nr:hypothetical protein C8R43DRAFT_1112120 [Mycena crocata]
MDPQSPTAALWTKTPKHTYDILFAMSRADSPPDLGLTATLSDHDTGGLGNRTKSLTSFDPATLRHDLGTTTLDIAFVQQVLRETGPVFASVNTGSWSFSTAPDHLPTEADAEPGFYPWMNWVLCAPAAHAVNAVRDELYAAAQKPVPYDVFPGVSKTDIITNNSVKGATDIIHLWRASPSARVPCTPHEFKRDRALRVGSESTLEYLAEKAATSSYAFRVNEGVATLAGKGKRVVCQTINEMVVTETGHAIICTQEQYVMLRLTPAFELEISRVYQIRNSSTQAMDMAELVLFYTHSALRLGTRYIHPTVSASTATTVLHVTLPSIPTALFQPYEGVFRQSGLKYCTKLVPLPESRPSLLPLPWVRFDGDVQSDTGCNGVTISHGHVLFLFLAARVVAKTACEPSAAQRLRHEFRAYAALRGLQGVEIPKVVGLFRRNDDNNLVLLITYAGKQLKTFAYLNPIDRRTLFRRLHRLHQGGVQHNDFEPRNVTMFGSSNPVIIDFDNASLGHECPGASCGELIQVAEVLGLNIAAELSMPQEQTKTNPSLHLIIAIVICVMLLLVWAQRCC